MLARHRVMLPALAVAFALVVVTLFLSSGKSVDTSPSAQDLKRAESAAIQTANENAAEAEASSGVNTGTDAGKVVNLVCALEQSALEEGARAPHLLSIGERARAVLDALEERRISTEDALTQIEAMVAERVEAERLRQETGLDDETFAVFWLLHKDFPGVAVALARELALVRARFPNAPSNADEFRQLKAETYKVLMRVVTGRPMIDLAERVLGLGGNA
jgi:hypothetical protein